MTPKPATRARLNHLNGTTLLGLALAKAAGCDRAPGPQGTTIAGNYRWRIPGALCFVIGDVIFCRRTADWLTAPAQHPLLDHELHHTTQYAHLGPAFFPLYAAASAWSHLLTGDRATRNPFERRAGLSAGGYHHHPLRPALRRLRNPAPHDSTIP